jgi:hypothetical protein
MDSLEGPKQQNGYEVCNTKCYEQESSLKTIACDLAKYKLVLNELCFWTLSTCVCLASRVYVCVRPGKLLCG